MLAHFCASLTGGFQLEDSPINPIIFSDLFFGYQNHLPWESAFKLPAIHLLHTLNFAGYRSLEIEKFMADLNNFEGITPSLYSIIKNYIQTDQDSDIHLFKPALRRLIFMYNLYPTTYINAQAQFLGSPNIEKYSEWRLDNQKFMAEDARQIKKNEFTSSQFIFQRYK